MFCNGGARSARVLPHRFAVETRVSITRRADQLGVLAGVDTDCPSTYDPARAQVAELVDALVSGTSGASREGSSPFLGTTIILN